jgi:superfamily II DNA or RNA helicase
MKAVLAEIPTGCGKTHTFVLLPKEGARTLIIVPFITLITQTVNSVRKLRECEPDIEQADLSAVPETPFVVASWQTLHSNERWKKFIGKVDLVVVDEAHFGFTADARAVLQGLVDGGARVLGVTATAYRSDKQSLLGFYEKVSYTYGLRQAIDEGYLCSPKVRVHYVKSVNLKDLAKKAGADFQAHELDMILRSEQALHDIAQLFHKNHVPGQKALMFCHSVKQATLMRELITDRYKVPTSLVHSYMSQADYDEELKAFTKGDNELIINVGCLTTGWDFPPVSEVYMCKPTKSLAKYVQMIGRGCRTLTGTIDGCDTKEERLAAIAASDKPHFVVHDITDSSRCHKVQTCIEVLAGQSKELVPKIVRLAEDKTLTVDEIDAAVLAEIEAEKEFLRLERDAERRRRAGLVVGLEFTDEERDIFLDPDRDTPRRREFRFPFGKWKGQPLRHIKLGYLEWALREASMSPFWKKAIEDHVNFRRSMERQDIERGLR